MIKVIKLESDKFDEIKLLFKSIFMNEPWNDDWSNDNQLTEYMLDLMGNRNSLAIGLYDEDELIGFSLGSIMHWCIGTEYYIHEFCIIRERQHSGLGTLFLNEIETYVKIWVSIIFFFKLRKMFPHMNSIKRTVFQNLRDMYLLLRGLIEIKNRDLAEEII